MTLSMQLMADVSSNNGPISIPHYSKAGHVIVAIKATEGTSYTNPFHIQQCEIAHEYGLTVLHYHYCHFESINHQAGHFREQYTKGWRNGDEVCIDVEEDNQFDASWVSHFAEYFTSWTHKDLVLYTNKNFLKEQLRGLAWPEKLIWLASYNPVVLKKLWGQQYTDGIDGPEPHYFSGIGRCDGTVIPISRALKYRARKTRTRRKR